MPKPYWSIYIAGRYLKFNGRLIPVKLRNIPTKKRPLVIFDGDPRQEEHLAVLAGHWQGWKRSSIGRDRRREEFKREVEAERFKVKFTPPALILKDGSHVTLSNETSMDQLVPTSSSQVAVSAEDSGAHPEPPILLSNKYDIVKTRQKNRSIYEALQGDPRLQDFTMDQVEDLFRRQQQAQESQPITTGQSESSEVDKHLVDISNPYEKERIKCILCANGIVPNYKNPKLLSQFISPVTGHIFNQSVCGLCDWQYKKLIQQIKIARYLLMMPARCRSKEYMRDPEICDPMHPKYKIFG